MGKALAYGPNAALSSPILPPNYLVKLTVHSLEVTVSQSQNNVPPGSPWETLVLGGL